MEKTLVQEILSDLIDFPENQMRVDVDREKVHELAENIRANGLINPITVRPKGDRFELVAGQRRLMAMQYAGIIRIPCVVKMLDDIAALSIMAAENIERADVDPVDEANFIARIISELGLSEQDMAVKLNRSVGFVRDRLVIAQMPDYMQEHLKTGELKIGVALHLVGIEPDEKRRIWVAMAVRDNASVRTAEYWAYQHGLGLLAGPEVGDVNAPNMPASEYKPVRLRCSIDGKEYAPSDTRAVIICKGNEYLLDALRAELNSEHPPAESELGPVREATPVGSPNE